MAPKKIPTRRPQAAPVNRQGMKIPADTLKPYVQIDKPRYTITKKTRVHT